MELPASVLFVQRPAEPKPPTSEGPPYRRRLVWILPPPALQSRPTVSLPRKREPRPFCLRLLVLLPPRVIPA